MSEQSNQNCKKCTKCKEEFIYMPNEIIWDESGYGYSTKLVYCPYCKQLNVIKYIEDYKFTMINKDKRYY